MVLEAVGRDGDALEYASDELRNDREVVLEGRGGEAGRKGPCVREK